MDFRLSPEQEEFRKAVARFVDAEVAPVARPKAPNIGRMDTGCGVGMDALGSPIWAQAMNPPLSTSSGLAPNSPGRHRTRSASLPTSTEPTRWAMPCAMAGFTVYLAT